MKCKYAGTCKKKPCLEKKFNCTEYRDKIMKEICDERRKSADKNDIPHDLQNYAWKAGKI